MGRNCKSRYKAGATELYPCDANARAERYNGTNWTVQSTPNPLAERWNGTDWSVQDVPAPSGSATEFSSVSCSTTQFSTGCNAVGFVTKNGISLPMADWNGSAWAVKPVPSPDPNMTRSTMSGVSCSTQITCMGVGFYDTSGGVEAPAGEQYG